MTQFHQKGGDEPWQLGTRYFGCRNENGGFEKDKLANKSNFPVVKMIEIKLSQDAKPGHEEFYLQRKTENKLLKQEAYSHIQLCFRLQVIQHFQIVNV